MPPLKSFFMDDWGNWRLNFLVTDETRIERGFLKSFCSGRGEQMAVEFYKNDNYKTHNQS